jgi:hypothetical protein
METYIEALRDVIRKLHSAEARHVESVPVIEQHQGQTVWDGVVEVFDLIGHPKTHRIYAWAHETDRPGKPKHVTVLHIAPVTSPETAVRAVIIQEYRNNA